MADTDPAGKKGRQRRGRPRKNTKQSVSNDEITCEMCSVIFVDEKDKLLECERCDKWFCTECVDMSDAIYRVIAERSDMHWYCKACETQAVTAVKTDKDIEEKCTAYMQSITDRLEKMEGKIDSKAEKASVEELVERVKCLESKQTSSKDNSASGSGTVQCSDTVRETIAEQRERDYRVKNIVIHNIAESDKAETDDRRGDDVKLVTNVFNALGVTDNDVIERCSRIGKKEEGKKRITKVTLKSEDVKRQILKKSRSLKEKEEFAEIYVGPDLTRMQRKDQYLLRKELSERKEKGEHDIFISRGKIVQARERAVQFRGSAEPAERI